MSFRRCIPDSAWPDIIQKRENSSAYISFNSISTQLDTRVLILAEAEIFSLTYVNKGRDSCDTGNSDFCKRQHRTGRKDIYNTQFVHTIGKYSTREKKIISVPGIEIRSFCYRGIMRVSFYFVLVSGVLWN